MSHNWCISLVGTSSCIMFQISYSNSLGLPLHMFLTAAHVISTAPAGSDNGSVKWWDWKASKVILLTTGMSMQDYVRKQAAYSLQHTLYCMQVYTLNVHTVVSCMEEVAPCRTYNVIIISWPCATVVEYPHASATYLLSWKSVSVRTLHIGIDGIQTSTGKNSLHTGTHTGRKTALHCFSEHWTLKYSHLTSVVRRMQTRHSW